VPDYDYILAEFYNSPTTNHFLMVYVAVVDPKEIPIGDMKVVATRLDHNLTYESPLSTWHYEGYNAPSNVVNEMCNNPNQLKLGGEEREISVLFCDLAGFTKYSEIYTPNAMIKILSEYFNEMTEQVFAFKGLLKEYVGDELMAILAQIGEMPV